jgi:hypothetical protein
MKLVTYQAGAGPRLGAVSGDALVDVARHVPGAPADMVALIRDWRAVRPRLAQALAGRPDQPLSAVKLRQPIMRPGKILAIGLN